MAPIESDAAGLRAGKPQIFPHDIGPALSPDGHWLAYVSMELGAPQVYVRAFPDKGGKWQVSSAAGAFPVWAHNGHELFYRAEDGRIMVATYTVKGDSFLPDEPRLWSERQVFDIGITGGGNTFDPAPDGKRMVALIAADTLEAQRSRGHVTFLLNFGDELQRKVPVGK